MITEPEALGTYVACEEVREDGKLIHYWYRALSCPTPWFIEIKEEPLPVSTEPHLFSYLLD